MSHRELRPEDILAEHRGAPKSYPGATSIDGVEALRLKRLVDDRGLFLEIYRKGASGAGSKELARFFDGIEVAQMNYSLVDLTSTNDEDPCSLRHTAVNKQELTFVVEEEQSADSETEHGTEEVCFFLAE